MKYIAIIYLVVIYSCEHSVTKQVALKSVQRKVIEIEKPFSNPILIYGNDFGTYFQALYRNNQFPQMVCLTSSITLNKFSREQVLNYYKHNFKFDYVLGNLSNINIEEGVIILTYAKASIFATRRKLRIPCILENDSVKIILNSLSNKPFE